MLFFVAFVPDGEIKGSKSIREGGIDLLQTILEVTIAFAM
jgi:hypothetical protein